MFTCIFPTSHKSTFLDFQNWWMGEVCSLEYQCTAWSIFLGPARNLSEAFLVVAAALASSAQEPAGGVFIA